MATETAKYGKYTITIEESGTVKVSLNGSECKNTKAALRDIAEEAGFTIDEKWNTRQTGKKLAEYLNTNTPKSGENGVDVLASLKKKYHEVLDDGDIYTIRLNGEWGFADRDGSELIAPKYDWLGNYFVDGMIVAGYRGLMGYVNNKGIEAVEPKYDSVMEFSNGYAPVMREYKWGIINKEGVEVIPLLYNSVERFNEEGIAEVTLNGEKFYIDTNGNRIDEEIVKVDKEASVVFLDDDDNPTEWTIYALESGAIVVHKDEEEVDNTKSALRYIAEYMGSLTTQIGIPANLAQN